MQGFKSVQSKGGHLSKPPLSDVVVVSIAGGTRDYQVCAELVLDNKYLFYFLPRCCPVHDTLILVYRVI